jgi:hypothetical protein
MFRVGQSTERTCSGIARRELLQVGGVGALGLSLADVLRAEASPGGRKAADACILFWLSGGPSQHETFDPKPDQPAEVRGAFAPIETNVSGIQISSLLPQLARQADRYSIIRSLTHSNPNHDYLPMLNGGTDLRTTYGSVITRLREPTSPLPPYVNLGGAIDLGPGALGAAFNPIQVPDPRKGVEALPDFRPSPAIGDARLSRRQGLLAEFDALRAYADASDSLRARDSVYQRAFSVLTTPAVRNAFDLAQEPQRERERYGASIFGQSCLLARRLVEAGTRFVQVQWSERGGAGWDTHGNVLSGLFEMEQYLCPRFDQGLAALLRDLHDRGLLQRTLVLAIAEFGRTLTINERAGRDHWPHVFSGLIAGGGVPSGTVVGASDAQGGYPAHRPVSPGDLAATLYRLMGLNSTTDDRLRPFVKGEIIPELV